MKNMTKNTDRIKVNRNEFLSESFRRDVYLLNVREGRKPADYAKRMEQIRKVVGRPEGRRYIICKHSVSDTPTIHALEACGFRLMSVDTTLVLETERLKRIKCRKLRGISIEKVGPKDAKRFAALLEKKQKFFDNTQFYRSPLLDDSLCDGLYKTWIMKDACGRTEENYAAVYKDKFVGFIFCAKKREEARIDLIWVDEKMRERGIGTSLILNLAKNNRYKRITVDTQLTNYDALRMYQRLGFEIHRTYAALHSSRQE